MYGHSGFGTLESGGASLIVSSTSSSDHPKGVVRLLLSSLHNVGFVLQTRSAFVTHTPRSGHHPHGTSESGESSSVTETDGRYKTDCDEGIFRRIKQK